MPHRVVVKIEGLRDPADAVRVAELGAHMIGLVFAPSPRQVTLEQAAAVVAALPPGAAAVGVFVDSPADEINDAIEQTGIDLVQLHGDEPPELAAQIARPCIKAFRVRDERTLEEAAEWSDRARSLFGGDRADTARLCKSAPVPGSPRPPVPGIGSPVVLLDAYDPRAAGGTGKRFNWQLVADARAAGKLDALGPIILAGGLDASCVAEAIRIVQPWAVDVASGVESSPGIKDMAKVEAFIRAAK
jgi:phosphoribosylanthranilate isomerase